MRRVLAIGLLLVATLQAADVTGRYQGSLVVTNPGGESRDIGIFLDLRQDGDTLTGRVGESATRNWEVLKGKVDGDKLTFEVQQPDGRVLRFALRLEDGRLKGEAKASREGEERSAQVDAGRVAEK